MVPVLWSWVLGDVVRVSPIRTQEILVNCATRSSRTCEIRGFREIRVGFLRARYLASGSYLDLSLMILPEGPGSKGDRLGQVSMSQAVDMQKPNPPPDS